MRGSLSPALDASWLKSKLNNKVLEKFGFRIYAEMEATYLTKKVVAWATAIVCCVVVGSLTANTVAQESSGYVASTSFFIYM